MTPRSLWRQLGSALRRRQSGHRARVGPATPDPEPAIARSLLSAVRREAQYHGNSHVIRVGIRIGELCPLDARRLRDEFSAELAALHTTDIPLEIEPCPRRNHCPHCDYTYTVVAEEDYCPICQSTAVKCVGGAELELAYLELEEGP